MAPTLLREILELGEKMRFALESEVLDDYLELLTQRGTLLDRLSAYDHPSQIDAEWRTISEALAEQHELLLGAASKFAVRMGDSLLQMERTKDATRSYHAPQARKSILDENLRA